ncbi:hypothetical protein CAI21_06020 [Alkalilimnicola ehrlichii]|uniref:DUF427 domain-containing protein n=1 Tax=Alkalilimnicola ehrlichii TaxID=351052 RepID=A0A3E0X0J2_9GAMM|nr:DUF427 domain-containing protein [Alkalilimnicola ehrlichii]RFA30589.1 hypothetical protein CAI21_06020 [Alkalilimnicola ehrlichii]RFA38139.1 hypothetical protein CAL65_07385 [Alkalilimnicola ehrlichii]
MKVEGYGSLSPLSLAYEPDMPQCVPMPKRIRGLLAGEVIVDSQQAVLVREVGKVPVYYFPQDDIRMDLLKRSGEQFTCPRKGAGELWNLSTTEQMVPRAAWSLTQPTSAVGVLRGWLAFEWGALHTWFEEEEQVYVHPRDPYTRIDILASARDIRIAIAGEELAASRRPFMLLETGLLPRYYLPRLDVWADRLIPSETVTHCPYKGQAHYYHVEVRGRVYEDIVWYYPCPQLEVARIANLLCFYQESVDEFWVDGVNKH